MLASGYIAVDSASALELFEPSSGALVFSVRHSMTGATLWAPFQSGELIVVTRPGKLLLVPFTLPPPPPPHRRNLTQFVYSDVQCGGTPARSTFFEGCNSVGSGSVQLQCIANASMISVGFVLPSCVGVPQARQTIVMSQCYPLGVTAGSVWEGCP